MHTDILLTFDHELFFGRRAGSFEKCIAEPTAELMTVLDAFGIKATFFVDILYYWRMRSLGLAGPAGDFKSHVQSLLQQGHDVQLHIHPHWIDATPDADGDWTFSYGRYRLHDLPQSRESGPESLEGCVRISKETLDEICHEVDPSHTVFAYRAGGWCVQPFAPLRDAFLENGIRVDSSVVPGWRAEGEHHAFDFSDAPRQSSWRFSHDVLVPVDDGEFLELPPTAVPVPNWKHTQFALSRRLGPKDWVPYGDGQGLTSRPVLGSARSRLGRLARPFEAPLVRLANLEKMTASEMEWIVRRHVRAVGPSGPVVFLSHTKSLSLRSLRETRRFLERGGNRYRFTTFRDYAGDTVPAAT